MKRLFLVITSGRSVSTTWAKREKYVRDFYAQLENRLEDFTVVYTTYDDISCLVQNSQVTICDARHDIDLSEASVVHFKNWMFDSEQAATIAAYLQQHRIPFYNSEVNAGLAWGKIGQMTRLAMAGLPVPDTFFAKKPYLLNLFGSEQLPDGFGFPLILKADDGAKGNDNHLIQNAQAAIDILQAAPEEKEFVLQTFLPNNGDYRFLFIGFNQEPLIFHRQGAAGSHLNNTSRGGQGSMVALASLPPEYIVIAKRAGQLLGREISGVDILVDKRDGRPYLLEVNSTPALATGYAIDQKNAKFADFLQNVPTQANPEVTKTMIGRTATITFSDGEVYDLPVKIDSGAYRSSIWATNIEETDGVLYFTLLGPESPCYSGKRLQTKEFKLVQVENSFGHKEQRYSVFLRVQIAGRKVRSNFTLANRGSKTYAALIGRKMLKNRFIVDVSAGMPLPDEEINGDDSLA